MLGITEGVNTHSVDSDEDCSNPINMTFPLGFHQENSIYVCYNNCKRTTMDEDFIHYVQVGRNGYFTFGQCAPQEPFYFDDATNISLVAPFLTNEGAQGQISYEIHSINASSSIFSQVDTLVNQHHDAKFFGEWLIVSTWKNITYTDFDSNIVRHHSIFLLFIRYIISNFLTDKHISRCIGNRLQKVLCCFYLLLWRFKVF